MAKARTAKFAPIVLISGERTPADKIAEQMAWAMYREVESTMDTDRNRQTRIGLSEIGTDCMKCLARKLDERPQANDSSWKAMVGTFGHAGIEGHLREKYKPLRPLRRGEERGDNEPIDDLGARFIREVDEDAILHLEEDVVVPVGDGYMIPGHCDLFIEGAGYGIVWDHKFLGGNTLADKQNGKVGPDYDTQLDAYGLGWELKGKLVTHVALGALPRDGQLAEAAFVLRRYDRERIVNRLAVIANFRAAAAIAGWDLVINSQQAAPGCWDCPRFERAETNSWFDSLPVAK